MKIAAISDLHGYLPLHMPEFDVLIIAGDIVPVTAHSVHEGSKWINTKFTRWADKFNKPVIVVPGNHDFCLQPEYIKLLADHKWIYLHNDMIEIDGVTFYGTADQPILHPWAFGKTDEQLEHRFSNIPEVDILITHTPPLGYGDKDDHWGRLGCEQLTKRLLQKTKIKYNICGHIHPARGVYETPNGVKILNVAHTRVTVHGYTPQHPPIVFDI